MRVSINEEEIPVARLIFPDGQPHVELSHVPNGETVYIRVAIRTPNELMDLLLVNNVLVARSNRVSVRITYLMGARMDRPINMFQPNTFKVVCEQLMAARFPSIDVIDVHNVRALHEYLPHARNILPDFQISTMLRGYKTTDTLLIYPDAGAVTRASIIKHGFHTVQCVKTRDPNNGKLSNFAVDKDTAWNIRGKRCIIIDDICDGGATFIGLSKLLREEHGAKSVDLFVTHGIFSKGFPLDGIDHVFTTNSYTDEYPELTSEYLTVYRI